MTELETIQHAKNYLDKLAQGINPLTNELVPEEELINNVRISRCFFFVSDVLRRVIENGGVEKRTREPKPKLLPFAIDHAALAHYSYSDKPLAISRIAARINELVDTTKMKKLSYNVLRDWLLNVGFLEEVTLADGSKFKRPTAQGEMIGITVERRTGVSGNEYNVVVYSRDAQEVIIANLSDILNQ